MERIPGGWWIMGNAWFVGQMVRFWKTNRKSLMVRRTMIGGSFAFCCQIVLREY